MTVEYNFEKPKILPFNDEFIIPELQPGQETGTSKGNWKIKHEITTEVGQPFRTGNSVQSLHIDNSLYDYVEIYTSNTGSTFATGHLLVCIDQIPTNGDNKLASKIKAAKDFLDSDENSAKFILLESLTYLFGLDWIEDAGGVNGKKMRDRFYKTIGSQVVSDVEIELLEPVADHHIASGKVVEMLHKSTARAQNSPDTRIFARRYSN